MSLSICVFSGLKLIETSHVDLFNKIVPCDSPVFYEIPVLSVSEKIKQKQPAFKLVLSPKIYMYLW